MLKENMAENSENVVTNSEESSQYSECGPHLDHKELNKTENVLKPILLEDYTQEESPESLENLMKSFDTSSTPPTRIDILLGLIYLLMVESSFIPVGYKSSECTFDFNYPRVAELSGKLPFKLSDDNDTFILKFTLQNINQFIVKLVAVCVSQDLVISGFVNGVINESLNVVLDPLMYFVSSLADVRHLKFQHLNHLSRVIKGKIAFPMKQDILREVNIPFLSLDALPSELLVLLVKYISKFDKIALSNTCRRIRLLMIYNGSNLARLERK